MSSAAIEKPPASDAWNGDQVAATKSPTASVESTPRHPPKPDSRTTHQSNRASTRRYDALVDGMDPPRHEAVDAVS